MKETIISEFVTKMMKQLTTQQIERLSPMAHHTIEELYSTEEGERLTDGELRAIKREEERRLRQNGNTLPDGIDLKIVIT